MKARHLLAGGLLLLCALSSWAGNAATPQSACRADYSRLCADTQPGGGRIAQCLKAHQAELSGACQASMGIISQCGEQVKKLCGTQTGRAEARQCLQAHANDLSAECRAAIASR
ncbi:cysteine rich repeat-containing protein [Polaromonas naphthalenivorans]|uniref:Cysteine rich repeat protein n=1 Tax=Polaromonas naphthalenivorans (strain CJ2) TaxID=365044 RepID=A1VTZ1_POLNA|nr:cysteine rich repeat-containing protein [Polaromonas naphthalenivorans]ABM39119.1 hypothetical protein Pnap_3823 [Polaromonas naphthalenivorans CJ2]